jgi:hypothetical protein
MGQIAKSLSTGHSVAFCQFTTDETSSEKIRSLSFVCDLPDQEKLG